MTVQRQPQNFDLRFDHDKIRQLFQRFGEARGEEKKVVAREMMHRLVASRPQS
ncbi:MAG: hypothetical protein AB7P33_15955 [Dehalococcoidia bacterium]